MPWATRVSAVAATAIAALAVAGATQATPARAAAPPGKIEIIADDGGNPGGSGMMAWQAYSGGGFAKFILDLEKFVGSSGFVVPTYNGDGSPGQGAYIFL